MSRTNLFWNRLFQLSPESGISLQGQIRQQLVSAILGRQLPAHQAGEGDADDGAGPVQRLRDAEGEQLGVVL